MFKDVEVYNTLRKLVVVNDEEFLCDIILKGNVALCSGVNLKTGQKIDWVTIEDTVNPAFRFGDYIKENLL